MFIFTNNFGFDTLTVNGCFEESKNGGFIEVTKSLAIENLNNLGIRVTPRIIINFSIFKIFISNPRIIFYFYSKLTFSQHVPRLKLTYLQVSFI